MPSNSVYQMWLLRNNGAARLPFPVLPERYTITYGSNVVTENIIGLGEVAMRGDENAIRVQFDSVFPSRADADLVEAYVPEAMKSIGPGTWKMLFDACIIRDKEEILQLNIVGTQVNMFCYCSQYSVDEGDDSVGTMHYTMEFTEYKLAKMELVTIDPVTQKAELPPKLPQRLDTRVTPTAVSVQPGDTLASISKRIYGDENMANALYERNKDLLSNPQLLKPGVDIKIPV